jgi:hypothetical protein
MIADDDETTASGDFATADEVRAITPFVGAATVAGFLIAIPFGSLVSAFDLGDWLTIPLVALYLSIPILVVGRAFWNRAGIILPGGRRITRRRLHQVVKFSVVLNLGTMIINVVPLLARKAGLL